MTPIEFMTDPIDRSESRHRHSPVDSDDAFGDEFWGEDDEDNNGDNEYKDDDDSDDDDSDNDEDDSDDDDDDDDDDDNDDNDDDEYDKEEEGKATKTGKTYTEEEKASATRFQDSWTEIMLGLINATKSLPPGPNYDDRQKCAVSASFHRFMRRYIGLEQELIQRSLEHIPYHIQVMLGSKGLDLSNLLELKSMAGPHFGIYLIIVEKVETKLLPYIGQTMDQRQGERGENWRGFDVRWQRHQSAAKVCKKEGATRVTQAVYRAAAEDGASMHFRVLLRLPLNTPDHSRFENRGFLTLCESAMIVFFRSFSQQSRNRPSKAALDLATQLAPKTSACFNEGLNRSLPIRDQSLGDEKWTRKEIEIVEHSENALDGLHKLEAQGYISRSLTAVRRRRTRLGLRVNSTDLTDPSEPMARWTDNEIEILKGTASYAAFTDKMRQVDGPKRSMRAWRIKKQKIRDQEQKTEKGHLKDANAASLLQGKWSRHEDKLIQDFMARDPKEKLDMLLKDLNDANNMSRQRDMKELTRKIRTLGYYELHKYR